MHFNRLGPTPSGCAHLGLQGLLLPRARVRPAPVFFFCTPMCMARFVSSFPMQEAWTTPLCSSFPLQPVTLLRVTCFFFLSKQMSLHSSPTTSHLSSELQHKSQLCHQQLHHLSDSVTQLQAVDKLMHSSRPRTSLPTAHLLSANHAKQLLPNAQLVTSLQHVIYITATPFAPVFKFPCSWLQLFQPTSIFGHPMSSPYCHLSFTSHTLQVMAINGHEEEGMRVRKSWRRESCFCLGFESKSW